MGVHVVVGGQLGSEGKGKVALHFARQFGVSAAVKVSGTNAGHSVVSKDGSKQIFRVLPSACIDDGVTAVLSPGCCFSVDLLLKEIEAVNFNTELLKISPNAGIITPELSSTEKTSGLVESIGSTGSGTGLVTYHRILCDGKFVSASQIPELAPFLCDTTEYMRGLLNDGNDILIEGAQGYGLSCLRTRDYPYCTSRDTTASNFIAEAGLSPFDVTNVIMVLRSYPIRVGGNSGPMYKELSWEEITRRARSPQPLFEYTSVSKRLRRVGEFDHQMVEDAQIANRANIVVVNFMDYIWDEVPNTLGPNRRAFIKEVERRCNLKVTHVGFNTDTVIPVEELL